MNRFLLIVIAANLLAPLRGQEVVRFDTVHQNVVGSFALGQSVFEVDSGYRVFGIQKGLADQSQDIYVTDFNTEGGFVSETTIQTYRQDWMGSSSPVIHAGENYYGGVSRFGAGSPWSDSLFLYKFDEVGDTLWTRFIAVDSTYLMRGLARATTGDFLITGSHHPPLPTEAYIMRTDSTGTIKSYHGYAGFDGEDVVVGLDGSWYVCGLGNQGSSNGYPILIKSDTSGNELWRRSDTIYGYYFGLIPTSDSCVVVLGDRGDGVTGAYAKAVKYDREGVQQWMRLPFQSSYDQWICRFHAGFEAADSTLYVAGYSRDTIYGNSGIVAHLDSEGNTIWKRYYAHWPNFNINQDQIFWDVKRTSDGGLVLTGETNSDDYPYAQLWLLKLDSMGCLVPGCGSVGVEEYTDLFNGKLVVAPNPANEMVSVALDLTEGVDVDGQVRVVLLDASGRLVLEQTVQQNLNQLRATLDVSALLAGTYYLHLRDAKRWLAGSKVVVE